MIMPLIWKEWHEQRWKLAFGTVVLLFFTGSFLAAKVTTERELLVVIWLLGGLVLSLYSAMGIFAVESSNNTTTFLASKPVKSWKVFACKWFFGWLNFAVPMLACSLFMAFNVLKMGPEYIFGLKSIIRGTTATVCMATMFYTMTCCLAKRKSSEAYVGFTGLVIFFIFFVHMIFTDRLVEPALDNIDLFYLQEIFFFINPLFWFTQIIPSSCDIHVGILFIVQALLFAVVIWIGLRKWQRSC